MRWERLGIPSESLQAVVRNIVIGRENRRRMASRSDAYFLRSFEMMDTRNAFALCYLEFPNPFSGATNEARILVECGEDLFWGDWRDGYDKSGTVLTVSQCRSTLPWIENYRAAQLGAFFLNDEQWVLGFAEWPDVDLPSGEDSLGFRREDELYQICFARTLRGTPQKKMKPLVDEIRNGRSRRAKLLLNVLEAIWSLDRTAISQNLEKFLVFARKSELNHMRPDCCISIDGSLLWYTAKKLCGYAPSFPIELADLIVGGGAE